jgi:hypothetical protein
MVNKELEMIKLASFYNELEKIAGPTSLIAKALLSIPKFLGKSKALSASKGFTGDIIGKAQTMLNSSKPIKGGQVFKEFNESLVKHYGPKSGAFDFSDEAIKGIKGAGKPPKHRAMLDFKAKDLIGEIDPKKIQGAFGRAWEDSGKNPLKFLGRLPGATAGQAAGNFKYIKDNGLGSFLKMRANDAKYYTKEIGGKTYLGKRSLPGRVINTATSDIGMAGFTLTGAGGMLGGGVDPVTGKKYSAPRRAAQAAGWLTAPAFMIGKDMATMFKQ